jgi:hypothetical protein
MTNEEIQASITAQWESMEVPAEDNAAVALCCRAFQLSYWDYKLKGKSQADSVERGRNSYRLGLPALTGSRNIRDFIACVTHGMVLDVFDPKEASKYLYAAQVAHTARRTKSKAKKTVTKPNSPPKEPSLIEPASS